MPRATCHDRLSVDKDRPRTTPIGETSTQSGRHRSVVGKQPHRSTATPGLRGNIRSYTYRAFPRLSGQPRIQHKVSPHTRPARPYRSKAAHQQPVSNRLAGQGGCASAGPLPAAPKRPRPAPLAPPHRRNGETTTPFGNHPGPAGKLLHHAAAAPGPAGKQLHHAAATTSLWGDFRTDQQPPWPSGETSASIGSHHGGPGRLPSLYVLKVPQTERPPTRMTHSLPTRPWHLPDGEVVAPISAECDLSWLIDCECVRARARGGAGGAGRGRFGAAGRGPADAHPPFPPNRSPDCRAMQDSPPNRSPDCCAVQGSLPNRSPDCCISRPIQGRFCNNPAPGQHHTRGTRNKHAPGRPIVASEASNPRPAPHTQYPAPHRERRRPRWRTTGAFEIRCAESALGVLRGLAGLL